MCGDPQLMYQIDSVYYNATSGVLVNYWCLDIITYIKLLMPNIIANIPIPLPQWLIDLILAQGNVFHMSWMEVLSPTRPLTKDSVLEIAAFVNTFPATSIGSSLTWMDLLYPVLAMSEGLHYSNSYFMNVTQNATICY